MTKLEWPSREDQVQGPMPGSTVPSPFVAQGIRSALRHIYETPCEATPDEFTRLLNKIR